MPLACRGLGDPHLHYVDVPQQGGQLLSRHQPAGTRWLALPADLPWSLHAVVQLQNKSYVVSLVLISRRQVVRPCVKSI